LRGQKEVKGQDEGGGSEARKERGGKRKVWVYGPVGREDRGKEFWGYSLE